MDPISTEVISLAPSLTEDELKVAMGIAPGAPIKRRLARHLSGILAAVEAEARPKLVWRIESRSTLETLLRASRRLQRYLALPEHGALLAATAGLEWQEFVAAEADPMLQYLYGAAGTALARSTLVKARRELAHRYPAACIADSLSPGTDGLPLVLQADIANALPLSSIGIELNRESLWMQPVASVTALIAFGTAVEHHAELPLCGEGASRCQACASPRCALRVSPRRRTSTPVLS